MRRLGAVLVAVLLSVPTTFLQSCGLSCTAVGYDEGFHLELSRPAWEPGAYRFEGTADGEPFACTMNADGIPKCDPETVSFGGWGGYVLVFSSNPRRVEVTVTLDGALLGEGSFRPEYLRAEPNGEGCGVQIFATDRLELPGPTPCGVDGTCRCVYEDGCGCGTDDVKPWPWSVCLPGTVPAGSCDAARCTCEGVPGTCLPSCGAAAGSARSVCVEGAWACPDPAFPANVDSCY